MFNDLIIVWKKLLENWDKFSKRQKMIRLGALAGVLILAIGVFFWTNTPDYHILYSDLQPEDASIILQVLKERKVPYKLINNGRTILAPANHIYELRLSLAGESLPQTSYEGFSLFDKSDFGETEFSEQIKYKRALQGELGKTISHISEIEWAKVLLVMPEDTIFEEDQKKPSASVLIRLKRGKKLKEDQIEGILYLVASSVEGLESEQVTIVDSDGKVLSPGGNKNLYSSQLNVTQIEHQKEIEQNLEKKVTHLLEKIIGEKNVITKVSVQLSSQQVEKTEESYNPDQTVVRSEHLIKEESEGERAYFNNLGTLESTNQINTTNPRFSKNDEVINYELSKAIEHVIELPGQIERLTVAVLVDGTYEIKDENKVFIPRTDEEIQKIKTLVENAVGFNPKRGDRVEVTNIQFTQPEIEMGKQPSWFKVFLQDLLSQKPVMLLKLATKIIIIILILTFIVRPILQWLNDMVPKPEPAPISEEAESIETEEETGDELSELASLERELADAQTPEEMAKAAREELYRKYGLKKFGLDIDSYQDEVLLEAVRALQEYAKKEPKRIAQLTREWLIEESQLNAG
ncbi:MAG: flagellar basal-body MS-ring/collar protein FliF [bacterium]